MDTQIIKQQIEELLEKLGFGGELESVETYEGAARRFSIILDGRANMLIGEQGNTLLALEHIVKKILRKKIGAEDHFTLDINEYRLHRLEDLKQDVKQAARGVRMYHKEAQLHPMSSFERRIVHLLLAEYPDLTTESAGEGLYRRVVIKPYP